MYKLSKSNLISKINNYYLVFNSLRNTFTVLNFNPNKYKEIMDNKVINKLVKQGILISSSCIEDNLIKDKLDNEINNLTLIITIIPGLNCQFRCKYCYEDKFNSYISEKLIKAIINFINKKINNIEELVISWFGGEPLLYLDVIRRINYEEIEICNKNNVSFSSDMTTNGYILSDSLLKELLLLRIYSYQITLDGDKLTHDKLRTLKNGGGTYDQIINNLISIKNNNNNENLSILIRINLIPESIRKLNDILDYYESIFGNDKRFSILLKNVGNYGGESVKKLEINDINENKLFNYFNKRTNIRIVYNSLITTSLYICYAAKNNSYVFMHNGKVLKCTVALNSDVNQIGELLEDGEIKFNNNYLKYQFNGKRIILEKCKNCNLYANCFELKCPLHYLGSALKCNYKQTAKEELNNTYYLNPNLFMEVYYEQK